MKSVYTFLFLVLFVQVMAAPPTVPSSNLRFSIIDGEYFNLGWTGGNGARRVMVAKVGSDPTFVPQNGVSYTANNEFGKGQEVATGEFIVYDHFSTSFYLTGLTPATNYYFRLYEYNGTGSATEYLTASYLSGSHSTSASPTLQTSNAIFSNITTNSVTINWTSGNGQRRLLVAKEGSFVTADPVNGEPYSGASTVFGNGTSLGNGNYAVYSGTGNYTTITNLKPGTDYHFAFFEYNGNQQPQYLVPGYTASFTTRSVPTVASSNPVISKPDGKELTLSWTNGNGQRRIVVAKQGTAITGVPANGTEYEADAVFGLGDQLNAGEYVVYDNNFYSTTVSGLDPGTLYYFKIFEYDGAGNNTAYLTSSFASVNGPTASTPTIQAQALPTSNITSTSLRLNFTPGNGRARFIIGRVGSEVNVTPADFTDYNENNYFGMGEDVGGGNFALAYTTGQAVTIQDLQPATTYHFAVFELNGYNQPLYLTPAATISAATLGALPVKLSSWQASFLANKVDLFWKTSNESNASHFMVERSTDGQNFRPLTRINATGNSTDEQSYRAVDDQPLPGKSFYRLKMVDKDEKWEYSAVWAINTAAGTVTLLVNPVRNSLQLVSSLENNSAYTLVNGSGQIAGRGKLAKGNTSVNLLSLPPGCYWLRVEDRLQTVTMPFIKQ